MYTYTAERRDVLGCTSPTTKSFPEARGPREISRSEGMYNPIHPDLRQFKATLSSPGMCQEIHPFIASNIKIDPSPLMRRECKF